MLYRIKRYIIFVQDFLIDTHILMFDFDQYLGFLAFLGILTLGFWLMIFLITFVIPYWIGGALIERFKENRANRKNK